MENFAEYIKELLEKEKPNSAKNRQIFYKKIREKFKKDFGNIYKNEEDFYIEMQKVEAAITEIEAEYATLGKVTLNSIQSGGDAVNPLENFQLRNSLSSEKPSFDALEKDLNEVIATEKEHSPKKGVISERIQTAQREEERRLKHEKYKKIAWGFAFLTLVFIFLIYITSRFMTNKNHFFGIAKHPFSFSEDLTSENKAKKLSQRLLPNGTEMVTILPDFSENVEKEKGLKSLDKKKNLEKSNLYYKVTDPSGNEKTYKKGSVIWKMLRQECRDQKKERYNIEGEINLKDLNLLMRLNIYPNATNSINAAYLLEASFISTSETNKKNIEQILSFSLKEENSQDAVELSSAAPTKIGNNYFIYAFKDVKPFLVNDLNALKAALSFYMLIEDENGTKYALTFSKGEKGQKIFSEVIDSWLSTRHIDNE